MHLLLLLFVLFQDKKPEPCTTLVGAWRSPNMIINLGADGTYEYFSETSSSNPNGSAASSDRDYGTWTATASTLTARSRVRGTETAYTLEKRNHPKNKDPMILLNGQAFVTVTQRPPW